MRGSRKLGRRTLGLGLVVFGLLAVPATAANLTWSGGASLTPGDWSNGANWSGGTAPSSGASIGTVTFPNPSRSHNDLTGVSVEHLAVDNGSGFLLSGNALTLGSGGLTFSASQHPPIFSTILTAPLVLSGSQTWSVSAPVVSEHFPPEDMLAFQGQLTGASADLTINLNALAQVAFGSFTELAGPDDEVGNVSVNGSDTVIPEGTNEAGEAIATIYKSGLFLPVGLNGSDGKRLSVNGISLSSNGPLGPLSATNSEVGLAGTVGPITSTGSKVDVNGHAASLSLDSASALGFLIESEGTVPGTNYDQLTSGGAINLGGAALKLSSFQGAHNKCPPPPIGQVYTLLSTTGSLAGSFGNVTNGGIITADCVDSSAGLSLKVYSYRINLNLGGSTKTITATALPAVPTDFEDEAEPPTISGTAVAGQTLSESHGGWTNEPSSFSYQWQRCDASGGSCIPIAGATAQTYTLSGADVGATVRVAETASNAEGMSQPQISNATVAVQAGGPPPVSPGGSAPSVNVPIIDVVPGTANSGRISAAQLTALLRQLLSESKSARLGSLMKRGLSLPFTAPEAGTLSVSWYAVPKGAHAAKRAKPVLIASGRHAFRAAGPGNFRITLTTRGKQLLKRAKRMTLTVRSIFTPAQGRPVAVMARVMVRK